MLTYLVPQITDHQRHLLDASYLEWFQNVVQNGTSPDWE
jgi:hypothetical protein